MGLYGSILFFPFLIYNCLMFEATLRKLTIWRNKTAQKEGVELFRVLPNKTLEEIARKKPKDKSEMIAINGIKEAKFRKYGREILGILYEYPDAAAEKTERLSNLDYFRNKKKEKREERIFSIGEFWDIVNEQLWNTKARIRGEVSSIDIRNSVVYFGLKDSADGSVINCFIFRNQYDILGTDLQEGMQIIVSGYPEIYKPYGRIGFRTNVIELEGEGALKKEYELLKQKLAKEGFFDARKKKQLCRLPQNIGLITSKDGAAIGDFTSNIGKYGLRIRFINSSVEGKRAVFELINAMKSFKKMSGLDAIAIIRGGGSLESLQAFNNETLIREAADLKVPLICGVGHERDISLLSLAADYSVSTPTAAAKLIGGIWEREVEKIDYYEENILDYFGKRIWDDKYKIDNCVRKIEWSFQKILEDMENKYNSFLNNTFRIIEKNIAFKEIAISGLWKDYCNKLEGQILNIGNSIEHADNSMRLNNPQRHLKMGYSIVSKNGKNIKSVKEIQKDDIVKVRLTDGEAASLVLETKKFNVNE